MSSNFATTTLSGSYSLNGNGELWIGCTRTESGTPVTISFSGGEKLGGFKDGSVNFEASAVDNSTRGDNGWTVKAPASRSVKVELTFNKLEGDAAQIGIRELIAAPQETWSTKGVCLNYLSAAPSGSSTVKNGFGGVFIISGYSEKQSGGGDNDATAVECTLSLESWGAITSISASPTP